MMQDDSCVSFIDNKSSPFVFPYTDFFFACLEKKLNEKNKDFFNKCFCFEAEGGKTMKRDEDCLHK